MLDGYYGLATLSGNHGVRTMFMLTKKKYGTSHLQC
jgi:hypothetical protein